MQSPRRIKLSHTMSRPILFLVALLSVLFAFANAQQEAEILPAVAAGLALSAASLGYRIYQDRRDRKKRDDDLLAAIPHPMFMTPQYVKNFASVWSTLSPEEQQEVYNECLAACEQLDRAERRRVNQVIAHVQDNLAIASGDDDDDMIDETAECGGPCLATIAVGTLLAWK